MLNQEAHFWNCGIYEFFRQLGVEKGEKQDVPHQQK